jgi:lantibiotic biosynthesis protein
VRQHRDRLLAAAAAITGPLTRPPQTTGDPGWQSQSLAKGAAGIALLHIERARNGLAGWDAAHAWLAEAGAAPVSVAGDAGLFAGAPAVAFALHAAGPRTRSPASAARISRRWRSSTSSTA